MIGIAAMHHNGDMIADGGRHVPGSCLSIRSASTVWTRDGYPKRRWSTILLRTRAIRNCFGTGQLAGVMQAMS